MKLIFEILTILGAVCILPYSLLVFSDGLQQLGGSWCYRLVARPVKNSLTLILRGFGMTSIFQNPNVAVQMIAGLLNAGLLDLRAAMMMVTGANMGSLMVLLLLFFTYKVASFILFPIAGILLLGYFLFRFGGKLTIRGLGKSLVGLALIGFWFGVLSHFSHLLDLSGTEFTNWREQAFLTYGIGFIIVLLYRSPSIAYGLIFFAFPNNAGVLAPLSFLMGGLLARSVSLLFVTRNGNIYARRVAWLHLIFGLVSTIIFTLIAFFNEQINTWLAQSLSLNSNSTFLFLYGLILILTPLIFLVGKNSFLKLIEGLVSEPELRDEKHLEVLGNPRDMLPITALIQGQLQISKLQDIVNRMFLLARDYLEEIENQPRMLAKLKDYERITDNVKREIVQFIHHLGQKTLTPEQSTRAQALMKIADELESVADYLDKLAIFCTRLREESGFSEEVKTEFLKYFDSVYDFYYQTSQFIDPANTNERMDLDGMGDWAFELKKQAEEIRERYAEKIGVSGAGSTAILAYSDMVVSLRKVRSHTRNIGEAIP